MLGPERKVDPMRDLSPARSASPIRPRVLDRLDQPGADVPEASDPRPAGDEKSAAKQELAANLEGMIEGMLRNTRFATAPTMKTRGWAQQVGEVAALDASVDDSAFSASSLIADLAQAKGAAEAVASRPQAPRRRWVDVVLILACLLSVISAGYLTFGS